MMKPNYLTAMDFGWLWYQHLVNEYIRTNFDSDFRSKATKLANETLRSRPSSYKPSQGSEQSPEFLIEVFVSCYSQVTEFDSQLNELASEHIKGMRRLSKVFGKPVLFDVPNFEKNVVSWFWPHKTKGDPLQPVATLISHAPLGINLGLEPDAIFRTPLGIPIPKAPGGLSHTDVFDIYHDLRSWCKDVVLDMQLEVSYEGSLNHDLVNSIGILFPDLVEKFGHQAEFPPAQLLNSEQERKQGPNTL